jgi:hypothetical protein
MKYNGGRWTTSASSIGCENRYFFCPNPKGLDGPAIFKNSSKWHAKNFSKELNRIYIKILFTGFLAKVTMRSTLYL